MQDVCFAHICREDGVERDQTLAEHNRNTAQYAKAALEEAHLGNAAYLVGLVHDAGKATEAFQSYLRKAVFEGGTTPGSVNHTFAAVRLLLNRYHGQQGTNPYAPITSELLSYAAGAHHGLFDCVDDGSHSGFQHRLEKKDTHAEEAVPRFLKQCASFDEIDHLFAEACSEIEAFCSQVVPTNASADEAMFFIGMLARLLCSAVIEGDRRDTAEFMSNQHFPTAIAGEARTALWQTLSGRVDSKIDAMDGTSIIGAARQKISRQCRDFADCPGGVYRLNVPTGGGKTLSSLRFALAHSAVKNKARIIFTSPLLSILEQNAKVIRDYVDDDSLILEHHSNVVRSKENGEDLSMADLLTETWDAPIIITTLVQLLNTMFDGRGSSIRRFHSLCNSVIVIDEVQTVPSKLISLFNLGISFLAAGCGATVLLCSATQPCSEAAAHPITVPTKDVVPYDASLWQVFRRTTLEDAGSMLLEDVPGFAAEVLDEADSLLIICNKKAEARYLYQAMKDSYHVFHLSAGMCIAHRRQVLEQVQDALQHPVKGEKVVCISTQVIEAGVDISFARVIRFLAGMDSMVQSAGRCNRNRESEQPAPVRLLQCRDEDLRKLPDIHNGKNASLALLAEFRQRPERFDNDLTSDAAIRRYYVELYKEFATTKGLQDGPVTPDGICRKKTTLFSMLSDNKCFYDEALDANCRNFTMAQAFKTAGKEFSVFDENTTDVLVPYGKGKELITTLNALSLPRDFSRMKGLLEETKAYTVSLYAGERARLEGEHGLIPLCDGSVLTLQEGYYDENFGFVSERKAIPFTGV